MGRWASSHFLKPFSQLSRREIYIQSQAFSETNPTKLTAISMGMTIGGTNQPFIARLLCSDFLMIRDRQLVSAASAF